MTVIERVRRRLAAILMLGQNGARPVGEEAFFAELGDIFDQIVSPLVERFDGHLVKRSGEGGLIEFASVLEAARCAIAIQQELAARNAACPPAARLELRAGLNLGDIIVEEEDIYGDGVNVAARLEALAKPGTIYVAGTVADQLHGKLDHALVDLGPHSLKNIERPVRVYRLGLGGSLEPAEAPTGAAPQASFETRPAIAVLPFANFSRDPEQEYFADGITEDIIGTLAAWRAFPVIARNSTFTYKGKGVDVKQVGRELGARYVVEGSIRRGGSRVRVTVQLIDASSGHHLMAEKWDRDITDLFELQDEIVRTMVGAMEPELLKVERERYAHSARQSADAYDLYQRGLWHHYRHSKTDNLEAQGYFRRALEVDAGYAHAAAALSLALCNAAYLGWAADAEANYRDAYDLGMRATSLDPRDPAGHFSLALVAMWTRRAELAVAEMEQAIQLNPSYAAAHATLGFLFTYAGRPEEAIGAVERGVRLSPNDPRLFMWLPAQAGAHYQLRQYERAVEVGRRSFTLNPNWPSGLRYVVAGLAQLGRLEEAAVALVDLRRLDPNLAFVENLLVRLFKDRAATDHILDGLRKAGFE